MELEEFKKKISGKDQQLLVTIKDPVTSKTINYSVSNNTTLWSAQSLFEKEPITIKWIRSFKKNSVFYDVGANIGMYSIFAGYVSEVKVYSFEPESNNFQTLMANIVFNNLIERINPDEIYNLGAQSHVRVSFDVPVYTADVSGLGTLRLLEAIRETRSHAKFYQASSSEMYGKVRETPQNEETPFQHPEQSNPSTFYHQSLY